MEKHRCQRTTIRMVSCPLYLHPYSRSMGKPAEVLNAIYRLVCAQRKRRRTKCSENFLRLRAKNNDFYSLTLVFQECHDLIMHAQFFLTACQNTPQWIPALETSHAWRLDSLRLPNALAFLRYTLAEVYEFLPCHCTRPHPLEFLEHLWKPNSLCVSPTPSSYAYPATSLPKRWSRRHWA